MSFDLIPLSAADRDAVFFFGTLTHADVMRFVLDRDLGEDETLPATLDRHVCMKARDASYPVLVPHEAGHVDGLLLQRPRLRDIMRINHFEEDEYYAERIHVRGEDGVIYLAWSFLALDTLDASAEQWNLARWEAAEMPRFLDRCAEWMSDAPA